MTTRLILARHGNTFTKDQMPTRVGARTDLPLVASGLAQGVKLGEYLKQANLIPDIVYASELQRASQTARQAIQAMNIAREIAPDKRFNEIDYGPDENKTEAQVIARIGKDAIDQWDKEAIVPEGWKVDPKLLIQNWLAFGRDCQNTHHDQTILVVTSNGIARFAPYLTGDFKRFRAAHNIKISTGALCLLEYNNEAWVVKAWNIKP